MGQALLFELPAVERLRKKKMAAILKDRTLARHLMSADEDERDTIERLIADDFTLAEAIQLCIENPRDEDCW